MSKKGATLAKTHCKNGHEYTTETTRFYGLPASNGEKIYKKCTICAGSKARNKTHCKRGHEYTPENTSYYGLARSNGCEKDINNKVFRKCIQCTRESARAFRESRGEAGRVIHRKQSRDYVRRNKEHARKVSGVYYDKVRKIIEEAKRAPCMDCGNTFPTCVMDFDHRDPTQKKVGVANAGGIKATLNEMAKCDLVCSNCHRIRTWKGKERVKLDEAEKATLYRRATNDAPARLKGEFLKDIGNEDRSDGVKQGN